MPPPPSSQIEYTLCWTRRWGRKSKRTICAPRALAAMEMMRMTQRRGRRSGMARRAPVPRHALEHGLERTAGHRARTDTASRRTAGRRGWPGRSGWPEPGANRGDICQRASDRAAATTPATGSMAGIPANSAAEPPPTTTSERYAVSGLSPRGRDCRTGAGRLKPSSLHTAISARSSRCQPPRKGAQTTARRRMHWLSRRAQRQIRPGRTITTPPGARWPGGPHRWPWAFVGRARRSGRSRRSRRR